MHTSHHHITSLQPSKALALSPVNPMLGSTEAATLIPVEQPTDAPTVETPNFDVVAASIWSQP